MDVLQKCLRTGMQVHINPEGETKSHISRVVGMDAGIGQGGSMFTNAGEYEVQEFLYPP